MCDLTALYQHAVETNSTHTANLVDRTTENCSVEKHRVGLCRVNILRFILWRYVVQISTGLQNETEIFPCPPPTPHHTTPQQIKSNQAKPSQITPYLVSSPLVTSPHFTSHPTTPCLALPCLVLSCLVLQSHTRPSHEQY